MKAVLIALTLAVASAAGADEWNDQRERYQAAAKNGDFETAATLARESLAALEAVADERQPERYVWTLVDLASYQALTDDEEGARATAQRAVDLGVSELEPLSEPLGAAWCELGQAESRLDHLPKAATALEQCISATEKIEGADAAGLIGPLLYLASAQFRMNKDGAALVAAERAITLLEAQIKRLEANDTPAAHQAFQLTRALNIVGGVQGRQGEYARAAQTYERLVETQAGLDPKSSMIPYYLAMAGDAHVGAAQWDEAIGAYQRQQKHFAEQDTQGGRPRERESGLARVAALAFVLGKDADAARAWQALIEMQGADQASALAWRELAALHGLANDGEQEAAARKRAAAADEQPQWRADRFGDDLFSVVLGLLRMSGERPPEGAVKAKLRLARLGAGSGHEMTGPLYSEVLNLRGGPYELDNQSLLEEIADYHEAAGDLEYAELMRQVRKQVAELAE